MTTETNNEYASKGVAGTGLGLGIAGTALGLLNGGLGMMGNQRGPWGYGNGYGPGYGDYPYGYWHGHNPWFNPGSFANPETQAVLREHERFEDKYVSEKEMDMNSKIMSRDSEIAILKSEKYTDQKLVEVYANLEKQINGVKDKMDANRDRADDRLAMAFEKANVKMDVIRDQGAHALADAFEKQMSRWMSSATRARRPLLPLRKNSTPRSTATRHSRTVSTRSSLHITARTTPPYAA